MRGKLLGRGLVGSAQAIGGDDRRHLAEGLARFLSLGLERPDKRVALVEEVASQCARELASSR